MREGLLIGLVFLVALGSQTARAQATDADLGEVAPFLQLFPALRTLPAPSWLVPGVRVSYQAAAAAIHSPDPASGGGVLQYDVVETDGLRVLAFTHSYLDGGSGLSLAATGAAIGMTGAGPFWINPSVLRNAESVANRELTVTRLQHPIGGQNLSVVRFQSAQSATEFDAATGVLVFHSLSGGTSLSQTTLLGIRTLNVPWTNARAPNWVRPGATIQYAGTETTTVPSAGTVSNPVSLSVQIAQAGARWCNATFAATGGAGQGTSTGVTGQGQLLGRLWLPRSALTTQIATTPVTVDSDPVTGARIGIWRDNKIIIQQVTPATRTTWVYDPTLGVLDLVEQRKQVGLATIVTTVQRGGGSDLNELARQPELPEDPAVPPAGAENPAHGCSTVPGTSLVSLVCVMGALMLSRRRSLHPMDALRCQVGITSS